MRRFFALSLGLGLGMAACSAARPGPTSVPSGAGAATPSAVPSAPAGASAATTPSADPSTSSAVAVGPAEAASGSAAPSSTASAGASASAPSPGLSVPPDALTTFYAALRELECGSRKSHVRVAWLGDSHAQADFWTGAVRQALQQRFGDAGPGFVHIGFREYRHDGVRISVHGRWRMRPKKPATTERYKDGNLGLGGLLTSGYAEEPFASLELTDQGLTGQSVGWDLCYKLSEASDEFRVELVGVPPKTVKLSAKVGGLHHLKLQGKGLGKLEVTSVNGKPELCGVLIETDAASKPGIVLDNLGLNGARYATALAWDPVLWGAELARRNPELVVLEFGGNEASDLTPRPEDYKRQVQSLLKRMRAVRADVSCLVVGLAERSDKEARIPTIRDAQRDAAAEAGCMFWDTYEVMGGRGSMQRWVDEKKAGADGIHLLPRGYAELGSKLVADLMAGYQGGCADKH